jgi:hypothetical protein
MNVIMTKKKFKNVIVCLFILTILFSLSPWATNNTYAVTATSTPDLDTSVDDMGSIQPADSAIYAGNWLGYLAYSAPMKFNISTPVGTVTAATLRIFITESLDGDTAFNLYGSNDDSWNEGTTTAPPQSNLLAENIAVTSADVGKWKEVTITDLNYLNNKVDKTKVTLMLSEGTGGSANRFSFSSKEGVAPPQLVLKYGAPDLVVTVAPGAVAGTTKATISEAVTSKFVVNITDTTVGIVSVGSAAPVTGANLIDTYSSGYNISTGVAVGKYLQVYDVDGSGKVVKLYEKLLGSGDIAAAAVAPTITNEPSDATVIVGNTVNFTVVANASDSGVLTYQWQKSTDGGSNWSDIGSATSANYTTGTLVLGDSASKYRCVVKNSKNATTATTNSIAVTLTVNAAAVAPTITSEPSDATVIVGNTATYTVVANASDSGVLTYQWQKSTDGGSNWSDIGSATSANYTTGTLVLGDNTSKYRCVVKNSKNATTATITSNIATVVVNEPTNATVPTITQLHNMTVSINTVTELSVSASASGTLTYQWYSNSNDSTVGAVAITNATGAAIQITTNTVGTTYYYCVVTNTDSSVNGNTTATATSNVATIVVNPLIDTTIPTIISQPQNTTVSVNGAATLSVIVSVNGTPSYKWYSNSTNTTIGAIAIDTTTGAAIQVTTSIVGTTYYFCVITNTDNSKTTTSTIVTVNVVPTTYILTYTAGVNGTIKGAAVQTVVPGTNGITVTATPNSGYHFMSWSDGVTTASRTDKNVSGNVTVNAIFEINQSSSPSQPNTTSPKTSPPDSSVTIFVNGVTRTAATSQTITVDGKTVTTVTIDGKKVEEILKNEGSNSTFTIPVSNNSDVIVGQLNGQTVKAMETKAAVLEIKTENVTYTLPASQINIDSVYKQMSNRGLLEDITVNVSITQSSAETTRIVQDTANKNSYQLVVKPIDFEITCTSGGKTVEVSRFNGYVERTVAIPDGVKLSEITTGIVLNKDGTFSHVPTQILNINGKYYAKINSLTNSTYAVIWNPLNFKDVEKHWAKEAINDMGSRMIISGYADGSFSPNREITRAEFAAIIVKALGLKPISGKNTFSDVNQTDWYSQYVETAYEYNIIAGVGNGKFAPKEMVTREQAVTMIAKAMKITNLKTKLEARELEGLLKVFDDAGKVATWAKESIAICVKNGIVSGQTGKLIKPKENITRAEVAVLVRKLLQKSKLID